MSVRNERRGKVELIVIDRPKALNSFDRDTALGLRERTRDAADDDEVRAIVVTGEGTRAFCTGADVNQFRQAIERGEAKQAVAEVSGPMNDVIETLVTAPKPVIAAVNGVAAGGGLGLALACDVRVASQTARFLTAFTNVGVSPDAGTTWLLPRTVGWARAREMILRNPVVGAKQALEWGLVTKLSPSGETKDQSIALARELAQAPMGVVASAKERLVEQRPLAEHLAFEREATILSAETEDFREGIEAFFDKREPEFGQ